MTEENIGIYGPFKNPDDIDKYWYQFTERGLEEYIQEMQDPDSMASVLNTEQDLAIAIEQLNNTRLIANEYIRCLERYKYDKKTLRQIQSDWKEYNKSLYYDWCTTQALRPDRDFETQREMIRQNLSLEKIKREEIEKRIRDLLK